MFQKFKNKYHLLRSIFSNIYYGFPSQNLIIIGVTGTDGKTTTVNIIYHILKTAKLNPSMVSSVGAAIGGEQYDLELHRTTPAAWGIQKFIKMAKDVNSNYLILEVTSHALDQYRTWGINFKIGVITNITREHLDYHKNYENYVRVKFKLLKSAKIGIYNKDDQSRDLIENLINNIKERKKWITYGIKSKAMVTPESFKYSSNIPGEFNNYNILAAIATCKELGINNQDIRKGIASFSLPIGRVESIYKKDFEVIIDFAHTPNSIDQVLKSVRQKTKGRLIHVFGSAGKRDYAKRPIMGSMASKYADVIVLTAEDPRGESIDKISDGIASGFTKEFQKQEVYEFVNKKDKAFVKINNRKKAIEFAIAIAGKGDLVIITGKSHEKSINYGNKEEAWDEFKIAREAIKIRKK